LHKSGELLGGDTRTWLDEYGGLDAGLTQNPLTDQAATVGAAQGGADEMAGDGSFAHAGFR
jgi:hypothetical protein